VSSKTLEIKSKLADAAKKALEVGAPRPFFNVDGQQREQIRKQARIYNVDYIVNIIMIFGMMFAWTQYGEKSSEKTKPPPSRL
jgi:hypothetical protein